LKGGSHKQHTLFASLTDIIFQFETEPCPSVTQSMCP